MEIRTQYSLFLVNKPGVLANICRTLADNHVNIKAMTLVDSSEHGVLRMVVEDGARSEKVLAGLNLPLTKTDVLCIEMSNESGALASVAEKLAKEHINVNYAYVTSGSPGGKTVCVFKVADMKKAEKVLKEKGHGTRDSGKMRASPGQRR
ncbi:MAG: ACT domain-containing protein [Phycisphaerae bacterium]|nr:ACT domain-containing protein [Phycisphaerae bacterium]